MSAYTDTPASVSRMTYATPAEVRKMRKLRDSLGIAQKTAAHSLWIPLRTWQRWEAYGDRPAEPKAGAPMYRVVWQASMRVLEAAEQRAGLEAQAQAAREAAGLPVIHP